MSTNNEIINYLVSSRNKIINFLNDLINNRNFSYETFGKEVEKPLIGFLVKLLKEGRYIKNERDYHISENKNEFPDFTLNSSPKLALDIKAGNHSKKKGNKWVKCKNSANDLITLNTIHEKLSEFGGENIYYIFIEYNFNDTAKTIVDVKIDKFYRFIGLNKAGFLKYRKKSGYFRPKDFNTEPLVKTLEQFTSLIKPTDIYRSKSIIKQHIEKIPKEERNDFLESLKN